MPKQQSTAKAGAPIMFATVVIDSVFIHTLLCQAFTQMTVCTITFAELPSS